MNFYAYYHYTHDVVESAEGIAWYAGEIRRSNDSFFVELLSSIGVVWEYILTLMIFTLSFFVNQAYHHWLRVYSAARTIQGRVNDIAMLVTAGAVRSNEYGEIVDGVSTAGYQSADANGESHKNDDGSEGRLDTRNLVLDVMRYLRMSHTFFWASTLTRSDGLARDVDLIEGREDGFDPTQITPKLLSEEGLELAVGEGQLTRNKVNALLDTGLPPSQYPYVLMEWAMLRCD